MYDTLKHHAQGTGHEQLQSTDDWPRRDKKNMGTE